MKYMFCSGLPGLGKRLSLLNRVREDMAPESSLPGRSAREVLKWDGMSIAISAPSPGKVSGFGCFRHSQSCTQICQSLR